MREENRGRGRRGGVGGRVREREKKERRKKEEEKKMIIRKTMRNTNNRFDNNTNQPLSHSLQQT